MRLIFSITFIYFSISIFGITPSLKFYHLTHNQGLSQSTVNCIVKDSNGYFWFGTNDGLNKWDGYNFTSFHHDENNPNSLGLGRTNVIYKDVNKQLWIGTSQGGIAKYIPEYDHFENFPIVKDSQGQSESNNVTDIVAYNSNLLAGTFGKGVFYYNINQRDYIPVDLITENNHELRNIIVSRLYFDQDSNLWIAHAQGVFKSSAFQFTENKLIVFGEEYFKGENIIDIYQDKFGDIWFGSYEFGAHRLNYSDKSIFHLKPGKADSKHLNHTVVRRFMEDNSGNLWIGTGGGGINIYNYESKKITYHTPQLGNKYSISSNIIYYIYPDEENNFWIGTYNGGVSYTNQYKQNFNHIRSFGAVNELNNNAILSFCETPKGNIWIGTDGGGINIFNPETYQHTKINLPKIRDAKVITALKTDSKGNIYIGTYRDGLYIYNSYSNSIKNYRENDAGSTVSSDDIWDIALSNDEETVWIATLGGGLNKYIPSQGKFIYFKNNEDSLNSITDNYLSCLYCDSQDNLWVGTYHEGICMLPKGQGHSFVSYKKDTLSNLSSDEIRVIYEDSKNRILVGTLDGGLNLLSRKEKTFTVFKTNKGLPGNSVQSILEDNNGFLWLGTSKGISKILLSDSNTVFVRNYSTFDGLQANEFNIHSSLKTSDGVFYFGGINGYNAFNPGNIVDNNYVGDVVIVGMQIFDKHVIVGSEDSLINKSLGYIDKIKLKHWQSTFTFEFAMLDYTVPEKNTYEYRLNGFDSEWVASGTRRRATYTNIDPGEYVFQVRGVNSQGLVSMHDVSLEVYLEPPFYQTPLFKLLLIVAVLLLLILIYRFRVKALHAQKEMLKIMVDDRTKELRSLNRVLETQNVEIFEQSEELKKQQVSILDTNYKLERSHAKVEQQRNELEKHRNNLEEIVKSRTEELEKAKLLAEESEQLKMAFLSNMSHEIRTPMNAIVGFASLLGDEELTNTEKDEYIRQVNMNSESLLILIDDILDLSKIEANQLLVKKTVFEVNAFVNEVFFNWQLLKQRENNPIDLKFSNDLKNQPVYINSDELRLRQILNNLLDNAFKFTSEGEIELKLRMDSSNLIFSVRDTGIGIQSDDLDQIFDRFRKGEESGRKLYRGAGLGLTISNKLAELLDGKLAVESKQGNGSIFSLSVPIGEGVESVEIPKPKPVVAKAEHGLVGIKVLIAEDEETNFNYLSGILTKKGVVVDWAKNGQEAVKKVSVNKYDLVLMDIKMPVMDGLEATRSIKSMFSKQLIIAQTAFARPEEEAEFRQVGFDDYIAKPIKRPVLLRLISKHLFGE